MLKRVALLGAVAALTIAGPSHATAQEWAGWGGGVTVNVGFPFQRRAEFCCEERRFIPRRRVFCCEERRFFPRRRVFCCEEERQFFPRRRVFCCEERRFFPGRFWRPPYYGDGWNAGYTDAGYGYDEY